LVSGRHSDLCRQTARLALIACMAAGCDESLPPRLADPDAISVAARMLPGRVLVNGGVVSGTAGTIEVSVSNVYTEVLQDTAAVNIRCSVWLASVPESVEIVTLDASSLAIGRQLQGGVLTLLPHETAFFDKLGNFTTMGGTPFWTLIPLKDTSDNRGPYKLSAPVQVFMADTVRIFKPIPDRTLEPMSYILQFQVR